MKKGSWTSAVSLLLMPLLAACLQASAAERPDKWAKPMTLEGVSNLHKVTDFLYRSAQPSAKGMKSLEAMGIKTVVNLRAFHSDEDELEGTKLQGVSLPVNTWHPRFEQVVQFLKVVADPENRPVLVHCQHGADRTGTMMALYRVVIEGWTKDDALKEMLEGGYDYHTIWKNLPEFIREFDVAKARKDLAEE